MTRGLAVGLAVAAITVLLIVAYAFWRPPGERLTPRSSSPAAAASATPSVSASASGSPSPSPSASPSSAQRPTPSPPTAHPGYAIAQWNFRIDLPEGWRRSFALSAVNANDSADAGIEVFTRRSLDDEQQLGTASTSAAWNGVVYARMRRVSGMTAVDLANSVPGGAGAARSRDAIDGRASAERAFSDGTTHVFVVDGPLGYEIAYRLGDPRPAGTDDAALRAIDATFHFLGAASRPGTGTVAGPLGYPSDFIPAEHVCAMLAAQPATRQCVDTPQMREQVWYRIPDLPPGTYWIVAYVAPFSTGGVGISGGYTRYVTCGLAAECPQDHTLVDVVVAADAYLAGIAPTDFYAPPGSYPSQSP